MKILQLKQLHPGDRFAFRNWANGPEYRVAYRLPEISDKQMASFRKRKTVDCICERGGGIRIKKDEWVCKLRP